MVKFKKGIIYYSMILSIVKKTGICPSFGNNSVIKNNKTNNNNNIKNKEDNPISKKGEKVVLFSGAIISSMGAIIKIIYNLTKDDSEGYWSEKFNKFVDKIIDKKNPNIKGKKRQIMHIGTSILVLGLIVVGGAILSVITKAPKLNYEGDINTFKKTKEMDAYIKGNKAEVELYNQMNERAKSTFDPIERQKLYSSYMMLQNAKNIPPSWTS